MSILHPGQTRLYLWGFVLLGLLPQATPAADAPPGVRTEVYNVGRDELGQSVVFLHDNAGKRLLPIWIGACEALAIERKLRNKPFPRPLTHDLFQAVLEATEVKVVSILVDELRRLEQGAEGGTYFAVLTLHKPDGDTVRVDARPSDAMALGVRLGLPIYVAESILDRNALPESRSPISPAPEPEQTPGEYY